jgi:hypothetical protein
MKCSDIKTVIILMAVLTVRLWSSIIGNGVVSFKLFIKSSGLIKASTFITFYFHYGAVTFRPRATTVI